MESFYDAPRNIPKPTCTEQIFTNSLVPDVSILVQNRNNIHEEPVRQRPNTQPYNMWNNQPMPSKPFTFENKENGNSSQSLLRKQVRFHKHEVEDSLIMFGKQYIKQPQQSPNYVQDYRQKANPESSSKPFEKIYMANVPNMHLDLSFVDMNQNPAFQNTNTLSNKQQDTNQVFNKVSSSENKKSSSAVKSKNNEGNKENEDSQVVFNTPPIKKYFANRANFADFAEKQRQQQQQVNYTNNDSILTENNGNKQSYKAFMLENQKKQQLPLPSSRNYADIDKRIMMNSFPQQQFSSNGRVNYDLPIEREQRLAVQKESNAIETKKDEGNDCTIRDLLKIIQQQNEQILILQKQVAGLLESRDNGYKPIENRNNEYKEIECQESNNTNVKPIENNRECSFKPIKNTDYNFKPMQENGQRNGFKQFPDREPIKQFCEDGTKRPSAKNILPKFAIDVMTSFEVSIRPQPFKNIPSNLINNYNEPARIREITESDVQSANDSKDEVSLDLTEPIPVQEKCPSPVNSIHVDMKDYSDDEENDEASSNIGWTIYNNVMGQVNNILKKAGSADEAAKEKLQYDTLKQVKAATLGHLRDMGVDVSASGDDQDSESAQNVGSFTSSEVSFAVKQLLLKYLPSEHLAKMTASNKPKPAEMWTKKLKSNPKFSFATVQYMQKYNLLENKEQSNKPENKSNNNKNGNKLLDITTLKQQPKLL